MGHLHMLSRKVRIVAASPSDKGCGGNVAKAVAVASCARFGAATGRGAAAGWGRTTVPSGCTLGFGRAKRGGRLTGREGVARPDSPRRCTFPITAFLVTPPSSLAIWLAEWPSAQSFLSTSTRSSVQAIGNPFLQSAPRYSFKMEEYSIADTRYRISREMKRNIVFQCIHKNQYLVIHTSNASTPRQIRYEGLNAPHD